MSQGKTTMKATAVLKKVVLMEFITMMKRQERLPTEFFDVPRTQTSLQDSSFEGQMSVVSENRPGSKGRGKKSISQSRKLLAWAHLVQGSNQSRAFNKAQTYHNRQHEKAFYWAERKKDARMVLVVA
jgi:hypothetical protein